MKLFAIVDKDDDVVFVSVATMQENCAHDWYLAVDTDTEGLDFDEFYYDRFKEDGYRCIELHVYDPEKQVVISKEFSDFLMTEARRVLEEPGQIHESVPVEMLQQFLNAGEQKP